MTKTFELHTFDIQHCIIALIESSCRKEGHLNERPETYKKLEDMLSEMNSLCWEGNNYTITIKAES